MNRAAGLLLLSLVLQLVSNSYANWSLLGNFDPGNGNDQARMAAMDQFAGKQHSVQLVFITWDPDQSNWLWPQLVSIWNSGRIPIISWQPLFAAVASPPNIASLVSKGQYDSYINSWGLLLKNFLAGPDGQMNTADDRRAFIRFAHEFNGNWYPWSASTGQSTPTDYVNMWIRVKNMVTALGNDKNHVQWIWSGICCEPDGVPPMEQYFPGNDNIDWIGMGGFNFGTSVSWSGWMLASQIFPGMVQRMRAITNNEKPLGITEYSTVPDGGGATGKNVWLTDFFQYCQNNNVRLTSYFNLDKNEEGGMKYWAIFGGAGGDTQTNYQGTSYSGFSAYSQAVGKNSFYIGTDNSNPKWVRDEYWFGTGTCDDNSDCLNGYKCSSGVCVSSTSVASSTPTAQPSSTSTAAPSADPSTTSTAKPSSTSTAAPSADPSTTSTAVPSTTPSADPSPDPSADPSTTPSAEPSADPSPDPSEEPVPDPSTNPSTEPSAIPRPDPSSQPVPQCPKKLSLYNSTGLSYTVDTWGGDGSKFLIDAPDGSILDQLLNSIQIDSTCYAGFGFFVSEGTPVDVRCFSRIRFLLRSTDQTRLELQDSLDNKQQLVIPSTSGLWKYKTVRTSSFYKLDKSSLSGLFLLTQDIAGSFSVRDVSYVR